MLAAQDTGEAGAANAAVMVSIDLEQRAVEDQGLDYLTLKKMVRDGMEHAFLPGQSLWADRQKFVPVKECAAEKPFTRPPGGACQKFLGGSEKARQQWLLEGSLAEFEAAQ